MIKKIAFMGLGNMGLPMAKNLQKGGYNVFAFDVFSAARVAAQQQGCLVVDTVEEAIKDADAVISMLPNGAIVEALYIDESKVIEKLSPHALIIDCSTVSPDTSRRVAAVAKTKGIQFIDAPVSGGVAVATAGKLAFMCGGEESAIEAARPLLSAMGENIFRAGDSGAGSVAKICNNMLLAVHMIGTAEALALGHRNGLDPKVLSTIMLKSSGSNWSLEKYNPFPGVMEGVPASRDYQGGFMTKLMLKDLGLAAEAAVSSAAYTPMGELALRLYKKHGEQAEGLDFSSIQQMFLGEG